MRHTLLLASSIFVAVCAPARATLLHYQLTANGTAGALPASFFGSFAETDLSFSVTSPPQASLSPGDVIQTDFFAPAGLQFVFTQPPGASQAQFEFSVGNTSIVSNGSFVGPQST
jgi:hypothetical protein